MHAAGHGEGDSRQNQQAVAQGIEQRVKQADDQHQCQRHDDRQAPLGILQLSELPRPDHAVAGRQLDVALDPRLRFSDRASQIAAPDTELDWDKTFARSRDKSRRLPYRGVIVASSRNGIYAFPLPV